MVTCFRCGNECEEKAVRVRYVDERGLDREIITCSFPCAVTVRDHFIKLHQSRMMDMLNTPLEPVELGVKEEI